jgi:hypothetical protein
VCRLSVTVVMMKVAVSACETMVMVFGIWGDLIKWYKDCGLKRSQKP